MDPKDSVIKELKCSYRFKPISYNLHRKLEVWSAHVGIMWSYIVGETTNFGLMTDTASQHWEQD